MKWFPVPQFEAKDIPVMVNPGEEVRRELLLEMERETLKDADPRMMIDVWTNLSPMSMMTAKDKFKNRWREENFGYWLHCIQGCHAVCNQQVYVFDEAEMS